MVDRVELKQPFSESVIQVSEDTVEVFKAAGWTEAKPAARKSADKK